LELLRPLHRSAGDFESSGDLCAGLQETSRAAETSAQALRETWCHILTAVDLRVPQPQGISFIIFVFVTVTRFATSYYGMYYLSLSIYIHTEMDPATGSIYLADPGVDRHHLIIRNRHSIFPSSWSHALLPSFDRSTQFVWFIMAGYPFISSHPLPTLLEPEPLFLKNSLRMPREVRRSVDDGLSSF